MSYGEYILQTGTKIMDWELFLSEYLYRKYFENKRPILDLGSGRCSFTQQNKKDIIALDNDEKLVEHYSALGISIKQGSADNMPFSNEMFEGVFCSWLFEHLEKPSIAMKEIHRILKVNGYALILVPSSYSILKGFYDDYTHIRPFTINSLKQLAQYNGFKMHKANYLQWALGGRIVLKYFGTKIAKQYLNFSDKYLRKIGLVYSNSLMLEVWK